MTNELHECKYCGGSGESYWTRNTNLIACPGCLGKKRVDPAVADQRVDEYHRANAALAARIAREARSKR